METNKRPVVLCYVPAITRSYLNFFRLNKGLIGVLGRSLLSEFAWLERDVRAIEPEEARNLLLACNFDAVVFEQDNLVSSASDDDMRFILPDEDISFLLAEKYLAGRKVEFFPIWLRWDKKNANSELQVSPDRLVVCDVFTRDMMKVAYDKAKMSSDWWRQVGALAVTKEGKVLVENNHHLPTEHSPDIDGDPRSNFNWGDVNDCYTSIHAEAAIVASAALTGTSLESADLYVTTFPCQRCARLVAKAGIERVFYVEGYSLADAEVILRKENIEIVRVDMG